MTSLSANELEARPSGQEEFCAALARELQMSQSDPAPNVSQLVGLIQGRILSDPYYLYCGIEGARQNGVVHLTGAVERREFKDITVHVLRLLGCTSVVDQVEIVPNAQVDSRPFGVVVAPQTLLTETPATNRWPMDEALLAEPVYVLKECGEALLVKAASGYWGHVRSTAIRRLTAAEFQRCLNSPKAVILEDYQIAGLFVPAGSRLVVVAWGNGKPCVVELPDGQLGEIPQSLCRRSTREPAVEQVLHFARAFLKAPYHLGGKNSRTGIDCSGLIQLSYGAVGLNLPRDARQQYLCGNLVGTPGFRSALLPGDTLYFIDDTGKIYHTALYLGNHEILHATGAQVQVQSLDPRAPDYFKAYGQDFLGAKRFWW